MVRHQVEFGSNFRLSQDVGMRLPSFPILGSSRILASCFQVPSSEKDTNISTSSVSIMVNFLSPGIATRSFFFICQTELITPIRYSCIDTELIHRMNCLKQEFRVHRVSIEVKSISTFLLLQDPTIQCTGTFEHRMTTSLESLYHFVGCAFSLSF